MKKMKQTLFLLFLLGSVLTLSAKGGQKAYEVLIETSAGNVTVRLYDATPKHRDNFVRLARKGVYKGLLFHRVIKDFMIQGGDPGSRKARPGQILGDGDVGYTVEAEFFPDRLFHKRGVIAMAREGDDTNPERRSSGAQFYIVWGKVYNDAELNQVQQNLDRRTGGRVKLTEAQRTVYKTLGGTPFLDGQYTVFGEVVEGLDVVEKIQQVPTDKNDRPWRNVVIKKMKVRKVVL